MKVELRKRPLLNSRDSAGTTPLMRAALEGNLASMKMLLDAGADPNLSKLHTGATPLLWAANDLEKVRLLLVRGAKPDTRTSEGTTPLIAAAMFRGCTPVLRALLDAGADPNAANRDGSTPLVQAASIADIKAMRFLIDRGSHVNQEIAGENPQVMEFVSPYRVSIFRDCGDWCNFFCTAAAAFRNGLRTAPA